MTTEIETVLQHLPGYQLIRELGTGGQARVYLAEQQSIQRPVAIKTLLPEVAKDRHFADQFLQEAKLVSRLSHPHIIPIYDFGQQDGIYYMVMEYLPGGGLKQWIQSGMRPEEALQVLSQVATALDYAHAHGVVHRDIKPDNLMFREDNSVVLMDFGIAQRRRGQNGQTGGEILGTPAYMSPEQLLGGEVDGRSDLYSLGILFFEMLTQQLPYQAEDPKSLAMKHAKEPIPKLPVQFLRYQPLFEKMVAKDPEDRFQTGREIAKLAQDILTGQADLTLDQPAAIDPRELLAASEVPSFQQLGKRAGEVPRKVISFLQDLHPLLDPGWEKKVAVIFSYLPEARRQYLYTYLLKPRGIYFNPKTNQFGYVGTPSLGECIKALKTPALRGLGSKLQQAEMVLRQTQDLYDFSDLLESSVGLIESFSCGEDPVAQKERNLLQETFLNQVILIVREAQFAPPSPKDIRKLTVDMVKTFLLQVYIRQRLMGYRFRTLHPRDLKQDPRDFVRTFIAREAQIRQCDIVQTEKYLFLIAPAQQADQNPYSIRRFLYVEKGPFKSAAIVWLNGTVIPLSLVEIEAAQKQIAFAISKIVSLERQLSQRAVDVVERMERAYQYQLVPMLQAPLVADGTQMKKAIDKRLFEYERELTTAILIPFSHALRRSLERSDDLEYLISNTRRILVDLACAARDFITQTATAWSRVAEELDLRLIAYIRLLDKREIAAQTPQEKEGEEEDPFADPMQPKREVKTIIKQYAPQLQKLQDRLKNTIHQQTLQEENLLYKWFARFRLGRKPLMPEQVERERQMLQRQCLGRLIQVFKRYAKTTVHLEEEGLVSVRKNKRHYALPSGEDGFNRLPALIRLPEEKSALNLESLEKYLDFDVLDRHPSLDTQD